MCAGEHRTYLESLAHQYDRAGIRLAEKARLAAQTIENNDMAEQHSDAKAWGGDEGERTVEGEGEVWGGQSNVAGAHAAR